MYDDLSLPSSQRLRRRATAASGGTAASDRPRALRLSGDLDDTTLPSSQRAKLQKTISRTMAAVREALGDVRPSEMTDPETALSAEAVKVRALELLGQDDPDFKPADEEELSELLDSIEDDADGMGSAELIEELAGWVALAIRSRHHDDRTATLSGSARRFVVTRRS